MDRPYKNISKYPATLTAGAIIARMIDGLGFRYYWATDGLRKEDLAYRPSKGSFSTLETIDHIFGLSETIINVSTEAINYRPIKQYNFRLTQYRDKTLNNLKNASAHFVSMNTEQLEHLEIQLEYPTGERKFPIWNLINGQIADAIYHTGQIVSFRRTTGNPIAEGVNVFLGRGPRG